MRGDFAFVYCRNSLIFLGKDDFGKKSLLIGFMKDGLIVGSIPLGRWEARAQ